MTGHCSKCHRIWTLQTKQGICQWCGQQAYCITATLPRWTRSPAKQSQWQPVIGGNGYDRLEGKWLTYYKVAMKFLRRVDPQEREDLLNTILLNLAIADENGDRPDTPFWMYRVASITVFDFIHQWYKRFRGASCRDCSQKQRKECREHDTRGARCPKAVYVNSLNKQVKGENTVELAALIPARTPDMETQISLKALMESCPERVLNIVEKMLEGRVISQLDISYLWKWRRKLRQLFPELARGRQPRLGRPPRRRKQSRLR